MKQVDSHPIKVTDTVTLLIYSSSAPMYEITEADAIDRCEARWQLQEGKEYDYEIVEDGRDALNWTLVGAPAIFVVNHKHKNRGKIKTGIYVGTVNFVVRNEGAALDYPLKVEVQSVKTKYREHYQKMLEDITAYYTDLVMQQGSPISQTFEVDYSAPAETLYQKFSFVKSIINSQSFDEAIHKVIANPIRKWTETTAEKRIESVGRLSRSSVRQIAARGNRVSLNYEVAGLSSLPRTLSVSQKVDTVDNHENQFVKYVLTAFYGFCSNLSTKQNASDQLKDEVAVICEKLAEYLNHIFFKQVGNPTRLNIGSPVLQRKEGYREVLQDWLMFDLAAKLTWSGGDNVYEAGKKNIAVLYEYWLFFKLMEIVSDVFNIAPESKYKLVDFDEDKINLSIKQGRTSVVEGVYESGSRKLNVRLFYNRTFSSQSKYEKAGSWTVPMRPDYTLSIWPGDLTAAKAEENNTIVHIHFDAKYRLDTILFNDESRQSKAIDDELAEEKNDGQLDVYKRGDLLKMHAYKDAIRRTAGAYVLYPGRNQEDGIGGTHGTEKLNETGFHEIIPGLGAFCVAPGHEQSQIPTLKSFILDVVEHFMDRTTKREKVAVAEREIYRDKEQLPFCDTFPEPDGYMFPDTTIVLVGAYKNQDHLAWIDKSSKFEICLGGVGEASIDLGSSDVMEAKYLLLCDLDSKESSRLYKIMGAVPKIFTSNALLELEYPEPTRDQLYMVFEVSSERVEEELKAHDWCAKHIEFRYGEYDIVKYINLFPPK